MKEGWEIKKLGEVCDFQGGSQPPKSQFIYEPQKGFVRFLQIRDFASDKNITYIPESKKNRYCNEEDILLGRYGASVGKVLVNKAGAYNVAVMKTFPNETILYKRYLYYYLNTEDFQTRLLNTASRSAQDGFSKDDIFDFPILIPPLPEQQRIVSILDEAFAAIAKAKANAEQNLKNAKELFESYLQGVFEKKGDGWISSTIGETCKLMTGGTPSTSKKEYYEGGNIKWLVSGDINQKEIFDCEGRITELGLENSNARYLPVNSVLIALNGQGKTRGTVAMLRTKATCNQSLVSIYPNDVNKVLPELIYANLDGRYDEIRKLTGDSGNDRRGLNMPIIRNISFSYPQSIEAQQTIVRQLDALRAETQKLEVVYQKKIADLEELKKSILQMAFAGELKMKKAIVI
jgi:type I restriction enzyme S subunit